MHRCARVVYIVIGSKTHEVGECDIYTRRNGIYMLDEEMTEIDMGEFDTLDSSEKTIAILGGRWWPPVAKQEGDEISKKIHVMHRKTP